MLCVFLASSCRTQPDTPSAIAAPPEAMPPAQEIPALPAEPDSLDLIFAGDIMAHRVNFTMTGYDRIYDDVRPLLLSDDLTFANFETPVTDALPMSTYPLFNVHSDYLESAVDGGFDVFSLANNHSNDQGIPGIAGTREAAGTLAERATFSGLRSEPGQPMRPALVRKNGWTVLFLAVTEILNANNEAAKYMYYTHPTPKGRDQFISELVKMRSENPCDVFVLSIHSSEPEYVRTVDEGKKRWFRRLADAGVDIVWANHPHVMQEWETVRSGDRTALLMYSMGNFISGQRYVPDRKNPDGLREYTGDGVLLKVRLTRKRAEPGNASECGAPARYEKLETNPVLITNWIDPKGGVVVKTFDGLFMQNLPEVWEPYYRERYSLMREYLALLPVKPVTAILEE